MRYCEKVIRNSDGKLEYIPFDFKDLKERDCFRLFENKNDLNSIVISNTGYSIFQAKSDAFENDEGIWQVDVINCISDR